MNWDALVISAFLIIAGVAVIVLGFFKNLGGQIQKIKIKRFGIDTELSTMGLWLTLGFLLSVSGVYVYVQSRPLVPESGPVRARLNIHFDPADVNPRNPQFNVKAYMKKAGGVEPLQALHKVSEGSLSVEVTVPDMETPFFVVFDTPKGTWKTDDHSIREAAATAYKIGGP